MTSLLLAKCLKYQAYYSLKQCSLLTTGSFLIRKQINQQAALCCNFKANILLSPDACIFVLCESNKIKIGKVARNHLLNPFMNSEKCLLKKNFFSQFRKMSNNLALGCRHGDGR